MKTATSKVTLAFAGRCSGHLLKVIFNVILKVVCIIRVTVDVFIHLHVIIELVAGVARTALLRLALGISCAAVHTAGVEARSSPGL